ncbi:MAG: phosphoribosyl-ATP diphosphatase, partial [Planctomycetota bacterium]
KLFNSEKMLNSKIMEEANELVEAQSQSDLVHEAADVLFFTMTKLVKNGISWSKIEQELDRRALKLTRRGGAVKETNA